MTTWHDITASSHRAHCMTVAECSRLGRDIAPLGMAAIGESLWPVLAPDWAGVAAGFGTLDGVARGRTIHGVIWHGVGTVNVDGTPTAVAWTLAVDHVGACHGLTTEAPDLDAPDRVLEQLAHCKSLTAAVWPRLIANQQ